MFSFTSPPGTAGLRQWYEPGNVSVQEQGQHDEPLLSKDHQKPSQGLLYLFLTVRPWGCNTCKYEDHLFGWLHGLWLVLGLAGPSSPAALNVFWLPGCGRTPVISPLSLYCCGPPMSPAKRGPRCCRFTLLSPVFGLLTATWAPSEWTSSPGLDRH